MAVFYYAEGDLSASSDIGFSQCGGSTHLPFSFTAHSIRQKNSESRQVGQHGQQVGRDSQRLENILDYEDATEYIGSQEGL